MLMTVLDQLNSLPYEVLEEVLCHLHGLALQLLSRESARIRRMTLKTHFRYRWLRKYGHINFSQLPRCRLQQIKLLTTTFELDEKWTQSLYCRMTVLEKVAVVDGLLEAGGAERTVARELVGIDREEDMKMHDKTFGIYHRHLKWRLRHHDCPLSP